MLVEIAGRFPVDLFTDGKQVRDQRALVVVLNFVTVVVLLCVAIPNRTTLASTLAVVVRRFRDLDGPSSDGSTIVLGSCDQGDSIRFGQGKLIDFVPKLS